MKRICVALTAVVLACGVSYGQEPGPNFDELKCYGPFIGMWLYDGPILEDVPGIAEKDAVCTFQFSWRRILNKSALESRVVVKLKDGSTIYDEKSLIGWDAAEGKIVYGGVNSLGGAFLGTTTPDMSAKTLTFAGKGTTSEGEATSYQGVATKTGRDTMTWQALERTGGLVVGPSPVYSFKRVKRAKRPAPSDRVINRIKSPPPLKPLPSAKSPQ